MAPGCFGSAAAHNPEVPECAACAHVDLCGMKAAETLEALRSSLGMADVLRRPAPKKVTAPAPKREVVAEAPEEPRAPGLSKKGADLFRSIKRDCPDIKR